MCIRDSILPASPISAPAAEWPAGAPSVAKQSARATGGVWRPGKARSLPLLRPLSLSAGARRPAP
eukprot:11948185-Alexandrium_andersonii.AAC.1